MTPRDARLIESIKEIVAAELQREIAQLRRKITNITARRDEWKETALRYQKNLIERNQK